MTTRAPLPMSEESARWVNSVIDTTCPGCDRPVVIEQEGDNAICSRCNNLASDLLHGALTHGTVTDINEAIDVVGRLGLIPAPREAS